MNAQTAKSEGFTLIELLIAVAIVGVLAVLTMLVFRVQVARGYDAKRKSDLSIIRTAFEEYYNDKECYPPEDILDTCSGSGLAPYLKKIPCDPQTKQSYVYIPEEDDICNGYRACVALKDLGDPDIATLGCDPVAGCGWGAGYNYCISSGVAVVAPGFVIPPPPTGGPPPPPPTSTVTPTMTPINTSTPTPTTPAGPTATSTPTLTPTPTTGSVAACSPGGSGCNLYSDPVGNGCPIWWVGICPNRACDNPANWCAQ